MSITDRQKQEAIALLDYINRSPDIFFAVANAAEHLKNHGFAELDMQKRWGLLPGHRYFVRKNGRALVAFETGSGVLERDGFRIVGAHGDSPGMKIKPLHIMQSGPYVKLDTECYGGLISSSWLDRPLALSGRLVCKGGSAMAPCAILVRLDEPLLVIPNLAIHLNRSMNDGYVYNKQIDLLPLAGFVNDALEKDNRLIEKACRAAGVTPDALLDFDLYLYPYEKGCLAGMEQELMSSARLDDLWMAHAAIEALISSQPAKAAKVFCCFDAEEIGSVAAEGADSMLLRDVLARIVHAFGKDEEQLMIALAHSLLVSADLAHGIHPNLPDKYDPLNRCVPGGGPVIKYSANRRYATDGMTAAMFKSACQAYNVPCQGFANRSDELGGTTIGPYLSASLGIPTVDVGAAILSMHSSRELGAVADQAYMIDAFRGVYEL